MSNTLRIEAVEMRSLGAVTPTYGLVAYDSYGSHNELHFDSPEALFERYPTRIAVVDHLFNMDAFSGSGYVEGDTVYLDSVSHIEFEGFPHDDSIKTITKEYT